MPAAWNKDEHDQVAGLEVRDTLPGLEHFGAGFVAEDHRHGPWAVSVDDGQI